MYRPVQCTAHHTDIKAQMLYIYGNRFDPKMLGSAMSHQKTKQTNKHTNKQTKKQNNKY